VSGDLLGIADAALDRVFGLDPLMVYLCTAVFTALETTALLGLVVPGDAITLLAGSAVTGWSGYAMVVLAATVGSLAGEAGGYALGRLVGPRLRYSRFGRRLGEHRWTRAESYLHGHGARALVAVRFVAVVHAVAPLVAGTVRMPVRRFLGWSTLGALAWSSTFTALGAIAGTGYREYGHLSLLATLAVLAAAGIGSLARRRCDRREPPGAAPAPRTPPPAADGPEDAGRVPGGAGGRAGNQGAVGAA
jgi:membrane-associated protein